MLKLTNLTGRPRIVRFGLPHLVIESMETIVIPLEQEENAKKVFKSETWQRFFDNKIFALNVEDANHLHETKEASPEPPANLKSENGKRKASVTKPKIEGSMTL